MRPTIMLLAMAALLTAQIKQRAEQQGVSIELEVKTVDAGAGTALATVRVTDAATGVPLTDRKPRVWLAKRRSEAVASELSCGEKVRGYAAGILAAKADVDLNSYVIATLNHDATVTFLNPLAPSNGKLLAAVELKSRGFDWVYSPAVEKIFISLPDAGEVVQIDAVSLKPAGNIALMPGSRPGRIALAPDGESVWVSLDGDVAKVAVLDGHSGKLRQFVDAGAGLHAFAFSPDDQRVFITNSAANTVTVVDSKELQAVATIPVPPTPIAVTWAAVARAAYVASLNGESVTAIDPSNNRVRARIPTGRGLVAVAADPAGRFVIGANQLAHQAIAIDSATNTISATVATPEEPDQLTFTNRYVYVRSLGADRFTLWSLADLRAGLTGTTQVQAGQIPASDLSAIAAASAIAATPDGDSVIVANSPEANLFLYTEGVMAPAGSFSNYRRKPLGVLVLDRSLRSVSKGVYAAPVRITTGGRYDVPVLLEQPLVTQCFTVALPQPAWRDPQVRRLRVSGTSEWQQGNAVVRFAVTDPELGNPVTGLETLQLLAFEPPGRWQERRRLIEVRPGIYETTQPFPHPGSYVLQVITLDTRTRFDAAPLRLTIQEQAK